MPTPTCSYSSTTGFSDTCPSLPANTAAPNTTTDIAGCSYTASIGIPLKQCVGFGVFGIGCYTYHCSGSGGSCGRASDCCNGKCDTANAVCQ